MPLKTPHGELIRFNAPAKVEELTAPNAVLQAAITASLKAHEERATASAGPVGENGMPRMLQISAWIMHAGQVNKNGYAFTKEGLEAAVKSGLFKAPFFGMIDFNHDYQAYGAWYDAVLAYDPVAEAYGILAHGAIWAWRFGDLADRLLAAQARTGRIDVSVSCLFKTGTISRDDEGRGVITVHDPVILTTSVLTEPPADEHGRGRGTEDVSQTNEERTLELLRASLTTDPVTPEATPDPLTEDARMDELVQKIEALLGERAVDLKPLVEAALKLPTVEASLATLTAERDALQTQLAEKDTQLTQAATDKATVEVALAAATETATQLSAQVEELSTFKADIESAAKAEAEKARREARTAEIPQAVIEAMEARDDKAALLEDWMTQDDAKWALTKATFEIVESSARKSLSQRSKEEGLLNTGSDADKGGDDAISAWVR